MRNRIDTIHFGGIDFSEQEIIHFSKGVPGFEGLTRFLLIQGEDYQPFKFLQSVEDPTISFPLLSPLMIRPDYHFALSDQQRRELELEQPKEALIYCVVTIAENPTQTTANLFSPVVINSEKRKAAQLMLLESGYPIDEPVLKTDWMLVVTRKAGQSLMIGDNIKVKVLSVSGEQIRIGVQAPKEITIHRSEVYQEIVRQNQLATHSHIPSPALLSQLKK